VGLSPLHVTMTPGHSPRPPDDRPGVLPCVVRCRGAANQTRPVALQLLSLLGTFECDKDFIEGPQTPLARHGSARSLRGFSLPAMCFGVQCGPRTSPS